MSCNEDKKVTFNTIGSICCMFRKYFVCGPFYMKKTARTTTIIPNFISARKFPSANVNRPLQNAPHVHNLVTVGRPNQLMSLPPPHSFFFFFFFQLSIIFTCWMWWSIFVHKTIFWKHFGFLKHSSVCAFKKNQCMFEVSSVHDLAIWVHNITTQSHRKHHSTSILASELVRVVSTGRHLAFALYSLVPSKVVRHL